jgi:hypothetical protein
MQYYFLMPVAYFNKHYTQYLGGLVFHREHTNGTEKIIKVDGKKYKGWLDAYLKQHPCPELKEITEAEAHDNMAPIKN